MQMGRWDGQGKRRSVSARGLLPRAWLVTRKMSAHGVVDKVANRTTMGKVEGLGVALQRCQS